MSYAIPWWSLPEEQMPSLLGESASDMTALADEMGVEVCWSELQAILRDIYCDLSPGIVDMAPGERRTAVRAVMPAQLQRLARGHAASEED